MWLFRSCAHFILLSLCHYNNRILTSIRWSVNDLQHPNRFVPLLYNIRCDKTFLLITFSLAVSMLSFYCASLFVSSKTFFTIHRYLLLQLMVVKLDWLLLVLFKWIAQMKHVFSCLVLILKQLIFLVKMASKIRDNINYFALFDLATSISFFEIIWTKDLA